MQQALIFWPLRLLVLCAMAMRCPMRPSAIKDGRMGAQIYIERGLGGIVVVTPSL
jgi:hypothetical protein